MPPTPDGDGLGNVQAPGSTAAEDDVVNKEGEGPSVADRVKDGAKSNKGVVNGGKDDGEEAAKNLEVNPDEAMNSNEKNAEKAMQP